MLMTRKVCLIYSLCSKADGPGVRKMLGSARENTAGQWAGASGGADCPSPAAGHADPNQQTQCCSRKSPPPRSTTSGCTPTTRVMWTGSFCGRISSQDTSMSVSSHNWASVHWKPSLGPLGLEAALKPDVLSGFLTMWYVMVNSTAPCLELVLCFSIQAHGGPLHSCCSP